MVNASPESARRRALALRLLDDAAGGRPVYLASPYTTANPVRQKLRRIMAARVAGELMRRGVVVFAPIPHGESIADVSDLPTGWAWWRRQCIAMVDACAVVAVLELPGWKESQGVREELARAHERGMLVVRLEPGDWLPSANAPPPRAAP